MPQLALWRVASLRMLALQACVPVCFCNDSLVRIHYAVLVGSTVVAITGKVPEHRKKRACITARLAG